MESSEINDISRRSKCCFCFKSSKFISESQRATTGIVTDVYNSCKKHVNSRYLNQDEFLNWCQPNPLPFCKRCFKWSLQLNRMSNKLEEIQKEIEQLVKSFTKEFIHSRNWHTAHLDFEEHERSKNSSFQQDPNNESEEHNLVQIKEECDDEEDLFDENETSKPLPFLEQEANETKQFIAVVEIKPEFVKKERVVYRRRKHKKVAKVKKPRKKQKMPITVNLKRIKFDPDGNPVPESDLLPRRKAAVKAEKTFLSRLKDIDDLSDTDKPDDQLESEASESNNSSDDKNPPSTKKTRRRKDKSLSQRKPQRVSGDKRFKCLQCDKTYKKRQYLKDHELTHDESKRFKCTICSVSYAYIRNLRQHLFKHEHNLITDNDPVKKRFQCQLCDKIYITKYRLKEHERTHDKSKRFECTICGVSYAYIRNLRQHLLAAHNLYLKCENKVLTLTTEKPETTVETKPVVQKKPRSLDCKVCGKVCTSYGQLYYHGATTHKAKPKTCEICEKECKNAEALKSHRRKAHAPVQKFECTICTKQFKTSTGLKEHVLRHNRDPNDPKAIEQYLCPKCGKSLSSRGSLNLHILRHSEVKRFECPMKCGKRFSTKSNMNDHVIYHKGERPFLCEECGKGFFTKAKLNNHTRIHTGLLHFCEYCGKGFQTTTHLKQHHRSHNKIPKESPTPSVQVVELLPLNPIPIITVPLYTCAICVQCFDTEAILADHMRIHDDFSGLLRFEVTDELHG